MFYSFRTLVLLGLLATALLVGAESKHEGQKVQGHQHPHGGSSNPKPNGLDTSLDITDYSDEFQGSPAVGSNFVSKFKFRDDSTNVVADVVMTGVVTAYDVESGSFEVNAMMISESLKFKGATLIAAGRLAWDGATKQVLKGRDSLIIMGGDAYLAGAAGTVVLAGGKDTKQTANFSIILPPRPKPRNL